MNQMEQIKVEKVVVNIGEGKVGQEVEKAVRLLESITGKSAVKTTSKDSAKTFGKRSGLEIGAAVTLRGEEAEEFVKKVLPAANDITEDSFDGNGNFSFGVDEYIDVPGVDYDSDIGMKGFEVTVVLERPGYRTKRRNHKPSEVGKDHKVDDYEAIEFAKDELGVEVKE